MGLFKKSSKSSICVFCGANLGNKKIYAETASDLGKLIAKNNYKLVYGAGGRGLMGKVAMGVLSLKGLIFGISTKIIADFEEPIKKTKFKIVNDIHTRKRLLIKNADAFIILPGGFGTYDELFDILVEKEVKKRHKEIIKGSLVSEERPIVLINTNGFFNAFEKVVDVMIKEGFISKTNKNFYKIVKTPTEAVTYIKKHLKNIKK